LLGDLALFPQARDTWIQVKNGEFRGEWIYAEPSRRWGRLNAPDNSHQVHVTSNTVQIKACFVV